MSTEGTRSSRPNSSRWLLVMLALVAGVAIGVALDRFVLSGTSGGGKNRVTKDNYVKIKPEMTWWEVNDLLGSGEVLAAERLIVDAAGRHKKYTQEGLQTGTISGHNGKPSHEYKQEVVWQNGDKSIYVTFVNSKFVSKKEKGLYD